VCRIRKVARALGGIGRIGWLSGAGRPQAESGRGGRKVLLADRRGAGSESQVTGGRGSEAEREGATRPSSVSGGEPAAGKALKRACGKDTRIRRAGKTLNVGLVSEGQADLAASHGPEGGGLLVRDARIRRARVTLKGGVREGHADPAGSRMLRRAR
jgi:hypothetical protein